MASAHYVRTRGRFLLVIALVAMVTTLSTSTTLAKPTKPGFLTDQPSMLTPLAPGATVKPILTVGDHVGKFMFEALPDGISFEPNGKGTVDLFINHEASTVPFPYPPVPGAPLNDFTDSLLSQLKLQQSTGGVLKGKYVIGDGANFHRFCSNYLADESAGFKHSILFTNEEGTDWVNRSGMQWPATVGADEAREIGYVVAHDVNNGKTRPIYGMGRFNHENSIALTQYGHPVLLSGDDTFLADPAGSQAYMYTANSSGDVWKDKGQLWAFVSDNPAINDYYDFNNANAPQSVSGHWIPVPKAIATGKNPDGTDMMAADVPAAYGGPYNPPGPGEMTNAAGTSTPVDGPQWVLEHWGDIQPGGGVFQFVRLEDMAFDRRPGMANVVYLVDSGRGSASTSGHPYASTNGRIWKMVLDPTYPTIVTSLSIFVQGDDNPLKSPNEIHQPDNIESTQYALYVTEDPGSGQQFNPGDPNATTARVWQVPVAAPATMTPAASIDQSADEGPTDTPGSGLGKLGSWEASGIIDVSSVFGPGTFLIDVQAHTLFIDQEPGPDVTGDNVSDWTYKREGGQLLLLTIPGA
ncbi:MAG: hypothetical protein QOJ81_2275 [Chloroflexota bacterium]|jgi:hypothetical protein|nr:hypothetical protein [Chloroflexota bacterium]